ncbi:hypothetical protein [Sediminicoccus sp. KRV36]|uniref:hypothetical protein n=1 Tax=Sediminicoccus sp. KRV36 TaxID=3133721 RepID=UPI00200F21EC|nr:hypothetical protein [Sediminicoccus rosea]UPY36158.1 hypothetical protein LHU95_18350 [Sediminicoccus rosea]
MKKLRLIAATVLFLAALPFVPIRAERSPVFGTAAIEALSLEASRDITARGATADYYGGLAVSYSYTAYVYSFYGRYYAGSNTPSEKSWYETAAFYAYYAYIFSHHAAYYSGIGM